jgi:hypothetical protein
MDLTKIIHHMLVLQDEANRSVNQDWLNQGYNWNRAIWTEAAELMNYLNWEWWKNDPINPVVEERIRGELVDMWHFYMSALIQANRGPDHWLAGIINDHWIDLPHFIGSVDYAEVADETENVVDGVFEFHGRYVLQVNGRLIRVFSQLTNALHMPMHELFRRYAGKNALNKLRQKYGYKEGLYERSWQDVDDNDVLSAILEAMTQLPGMDGVVIDDPEGYHTMVSELLDERYRKDCPAAVDFYEMLTFK